MIHSRQLAQIIGPTLSAMTLSEIKNLSIWESTIPSIAWHNGILFFLEGYNVRCNFIAMY